MHRTYAFIFPTSAQNFEVEHISTWANWNVERVDSRVALKGDNGKYLSICPNCLKDSTSPQDAVFVNADTPTENAL